MPTALYLRDVELDTLREIASIGCGRAVTALGRLVGLRADMDVPQARIAAAEGDLSAMLAPLGDAVLAVALELEGFLGGVLALVLPEPDARRLANLLGVPVPDASRSTLAESAILEAGNIAGSAFVSAVGRLTGTTMLLSVPRLERGSGSVWLGALVGLIAGRLVLATGFTLGGGPQAAAAPGDDVIRGLIIAVPDPARLPDLLAALPGA